MQPIPLQKQNQDGNAFDYNYATPYVQNFTLSMTRDLSRTLNLDVRYIGTRGLKLAGQYNLNIPDVFYNPALFDALERTRRGEDVELFDYADDVETAFRLLETGLTKYYLEPDKELPAIAKSRV